ncbi:nuclear transport factor 2 family protein [Halostagnicola sp. A-GB9-2]|uniref:nuclear transport factor 2 family protein n=1 Tax=Halostagnicola sp. A-GB9-2 TaxID=3048066 RepID=UPI0024C07F80|nr:nuclear transport factor 2 family protein [Halostagnicola sp. A-GB9-2]MDJ1432342.1 nuclear transport factor 2 family protein [Halostagnicola sp. A-GB9-2]
MDGDLLVRRYYDALDDHEYETLEGILDPAFVQRRPDRTFDGREAFVEFMREERPNPDTSHELDAVVVGDEGDQVAARGRVLEGETELFEFADFFETANGSIVRLDTYSR